MRKFVQKQNRIQRSGSTPPARSGKVIRKQLINADSIRRLQRTVGNQAVSRLLQSEEEGQLPTDQSIDEGTLDGDKTGRTIRVSGGQSFVMYGYDKFPKNVQAALKDGWISFLDMYELWMSGKHMGPLDESGHDMMERLTQRSLPGAKGGGKGKMIKGLKPWERLTFEGETGVGALKPPSWGNRYEHYLFWGLNPSFDAVVPKATKVGIKSPPKGTEVHTKGKMQHANNLKRYLAEINSEKTIAPDDKVALRRLMFLHYVMRYPKDDMRGSGIPVLPEPTDPQKGEYKKLLKREVPELFLLNNLALTMGLPDTM